MAVMVKVVLEDLLNRQIETKAPIDAQSVVVAVGPIGAFWFHKTTRKAPLGGYPIFRQVQPNPTAPAPES